MSLAIWMDFWDWDGSPSSVSATDSIPPGFFSFGNTRGAGTETNTYQMLPDDYWDNRQASMKADVPTSDASVPKENEANVTITTKSSEPNAEREALLSSLKNATSLDELKAISSKLAA